MRFAAVLLLCIPAVSAQWVNYPAKGIPRTKDGKPNLNARAPQGKDLSGIWHVPPATLGPGGPPKYVTYLAADLPQDSVPLRPQARELVRQRLARSGADIPFSRCLPAGLPMVMLFPAPFKIFHNTGVTVFLYETNGAYRQVFTDGRALPKEPQPSWLGYSVGRWERDVFVVETTGFNDKTWIDAIGHPHGEKLRLTERYRRRDFGHMTVEIMIDDPDWYERSWTVQVELELTPDTELLEDICLENERDAAHLVGK